MALPAIAHGCDGVKALTTQSASLLQLDTMHGRKELEVEHSIDLDDEFFCLFCEDLVKHIDY